MKSPAYLTQRDTARLFRVTEATVRHWRASGRLPFVRLGSHNIRIARADLRAFVLAATTPGVSK